MPSEKNFSLVEGPWKEFSFKRIDGSSQITVSRVVSHILTYFLRDEPTCILLGGYSDSEFGKEMEASVRVILKDNLSFLVEHRDTGELAAVRITYRSTPTTTFDSVPIKSASGKAISRLGAILKKEVNLFEKFDVKEIGRLFVASCTPKYQRKGITTELYRRSLAFLKAEGFLLAQSMFTNPWTRRIALKLDFIETNRVYYKDLKKEDGSEYVFPKESLTPEHYAAIMVKVL